MDLRHYGPRSVFLYYDMITSNNRALLYIYDIMVHGQAFCILTCGVLLLGVIML
jgi:hypothetical protein